MVKWYKLRKRIFRYIFVNILFKNEFKNSNIVKFAKQELDLASNKEETPDNWMYNDILDLMVVFASQGHSGSSAPIAIELFSKLASWKPITNPKFSDNEWSACSKDYYQNTRDSRYFKDTKGICYNDAFLKRVTHTKYFGENTTVKNKKYSLWYGKVYEKKGNIATGRYFGKCYLTENNIKNSITFDKPIILNSLEVEVGEDDWIMFVNHNNLKLRELGRNYNIAWLHNPKIENKNIFELNKSDFN